MIDRLFSFQSNAVKDIQQKTKYALKAYSDTGTPQIVSLQAPTGAGKTIIMISFVENVLFGSDDDLDNPDAVFLWLSDSPQLNEQSKNKFLRSDKIKFNQLVTIEESNFDKELLEDGKIYFLNTQKIGAKGKLSQKGDTRNWTIWETINNTAKQKADRFYFIIDEAHRGAQGTEAGKATSIMQRFIKGSEDWGLDKPLPLVIGISATLERFNTLVGTTSSTQSKVIVKADDVRSSGLLKKRIVITYPENPSDNSDMTVLKAATEDWIEKTKHWKDYCVIQHDKMVNPIFIIQVKAGNSSVVSTTDLDAVVSTIEEVLGYKFSNNQVAHTFGETRSIVANGLKINHIEPSEISDDKNVQVVLFKENLSTGWDCPRAESMMSFRSAEDSTYIAQLLGRMVRTPLGREILSDDTLNDVRLFLPNFNKENVENVIKELQSPECGDIPAFVDEEILNPGPRRSHTINFPPLDPNIAPFLPEKNVAKPDNSPSLTNSFEKTTYAPVPEIDHGAGDMVFRNRRDSDHKKDEPPKAEPSLLDIAINRREIEFFINNGRFVTYTVRHAKIRDYLTSLFDMVTFLSHNGIDKTAKEELDKFLLQDIHSYVENIRRLGKYDKTVEDVLAIKLTSNVFDIFGASIVNMEGNRQMLLFGSNELDRYVSLFDRSYGSYGIPYMYGRTYQDNDNPDSYKIDLIVYDANKENRSRIEKMAREKLYELDDKYRLVVHQTLSEKQASEYDKIISNSDEISKHPFLLPEKADLSENPNGKDYTDHLFVREDTGTWKVKLNSWEEKTLEEERKRSDFVCWFRNPANANYSLVIPYVYNRQNKGMHPDFLIVRSHPEMKYILDILEPHLPSFDDNLPKAQGLAEYAENHPSFGRIQLIREYADEFGKKRLVRLDFTKREIREKVKAMTMPEQLNGLFNEYGFSES